MPDLAVSTRVSTMYAEIRLRMFPDENLGRWIIGVVGPALLAGACWLKRGSQAPRPPPSLARCCGSRDENPIVAPDDIYLNLRDRAGRDPHRHAALRGPVRAGRIREEAGRDGRQPRARRRRRPHEPAQKG